MVQNIEDSGKSLVQPTFIDCSMLNSSFVRLEACLKFETCSNSLLFIILGFGKLDQAIEPIMVLHYKLDSNFFAQSPTSLGQHVCSGGASSYRYIIGPKYIFSYKYFPANGVFRPNFFSLTQNF